MSDFGSGHDLAVPEFEPCIGLCADSSEPGTSFGFCVSLSLSAPLPLMLARSLSKVNIFFKEENVGLQDPLFPVVLFRGKYFLSYTIAVMVRLAQA